MAELSEYYNKTKTNTYSNRASLSVQLSGGSSEILPDLDFLNHFKIEIEGQTDKLNQKEYKKFDVFYQNSDFFTASFLRMNNTYGILAPEVTNKYVALKGTNLKEIFKNIGCSEEIIERIPDQIEQKDYSQLIAMSDEQKEEILSTYANIFINNIPKEQYKKNPKTQISVLQNQYDVTSYEMSLTEKQLYTIETKVLEILENDQRMLSIFNNIASMDPNNTFTGEQIKGFVKGLFNVEGVSVEELSNDIALRVIVYEAKDTLIRTEIISAKERVTIDFIKDSSTMEFNINYMPDQLNTGSSTSLGMKKEKTAGDVKITVSLNMIENGSETINMRATAHMIGTIDSSDMIENYEVNLQYKDFKAVLNYTNNVTYDSTLQVEELGKDNAGFLNDYNSDTLIVLVNGIASRLQEMLIQKAELLRTTPEGIIPGALEFLEGIKIDASVVARGQEDSVDRIEDNVDGLSQLEQTTRQMFNAKFEQYKGEQTGSTTKALLTLLKTNNLGTEKAQKVALKINSNDILPEVLTEDLFNYIIVQIEATTKYTINVEYDETTKYVNKVVVMDVI